MAVAAAHLRDVAADWYEADRININQYQDGNNTSFIRWIKVWFILDVQKDQWYAELYQLKQAPRQSVDDYANKFQKLQWKTDIVERTPVANIV